MGKYSMRLEDLQTSLLRNFAQNKEQRNRSGVRGALWRVFLVCSFVIRWRELQPISMLKGRLQERQRVTLAIHERGDNCSQSLSR